MIPSFKVWVGQMFAPRSKLTSGMMLKLAPIDAEVKLFGEAFSPMAKRNVASSLVQKINAYEEDWKKAYGIAPMPSPLLALRAEARKEAGDTGAGPKYTQVACIAHSVVTGKFDESLFVAKWDSANSKHTFNQNIVEYEGGSVDRADANGKIAKMKMAILRAETSVANSSDASTLKIFMAPEFFFRGSNGAYGIEMVSEIFEKLRSFTASSRFKDWLFVFGTVIAASYDDRLYCRKCGAQGTNGLTRVGLRRFVCKTVGCPPNSVAEYRAGARIDNVALVQKGGESDDKNAYVIAKEYVSHIDFRRAVTLNELNKGKLATGYDSTVILADWDTDRRIEIKGRKVQALPPTGSQDVGGSASAFADERMGGAIFTIDGIRFGLEICLDHLVARIPAGTGIQVQLVPSAGASLKVLTTIPGGIGFNVDGLAGKGDVRVNAVGAAPKFEIDGEVTIFEPVALPYA